LRRAYDYWQNQPGCYLPLLQRCPMPPSYHISYRNRTRNTEKTGKSHTLQTTKQQRLPTQTLKTQTSAVSSIVAHLLLLLKGSRHLKLVLSFSSSRTTTQQPTTHTRRAWCNRMPVLRAEHAKANLIKPCWDYTTNATNAKGN